MHAGWFVVAVVSIVLGGCGGTVTGEGTGTSGGGSSGASGSGGSVQGNGGIAVSGAPNTGGRPITGRTPVNHRPVAVACPGGTLAGPSLPCASDAECTAGPQGRCLPPGGQGTCVYSYCAADKDCAANQLCECSPDGYSNRCVNATGCALDADCPGSWCSPSFGSCGSYSGVQSYECHTAGDLCLDDADCPGGYCAYNPAVGYWMCGSSVCVG